MFSIKLCDIINAFLDSDLELVWVVILGEILCWICFFFFSSRRRHTRYWRDWEFRRVLFRSVEHIDHYHCAERVQVDARLKKLRLDAVGALLQIPLELWETGYHKDEEMEADREGMHLAVLSGYSPYGAVSVFERLAKLHREYVIHAESPEQELSELAIQSMTGYFRSHPLPSERLALANNLIAQEHWENRKTQRPFRFEYEVPNGEYVN